MDSVFIITLLFSVFVISSAKTCSRRAFSLGGAFKSCTDLPHLGAHLHWTYFPSVRKVSIAYRAKQSSQGWIAWGINPTSRGMVGSQALVAFRNSNGSMTVYTTSITSYNPSMLPSELSFRMTIYAMVGPLENGTSVNQVWQAGSSVSSNIPQIHSTSPPNLQSMGKIDFRSA
ncbi:hypothetical protein CDL12_09805 [Handroanthus impetiginosus]|uniref:DOMON domain-containing protein n=1 Tax=Handroanthus impetiginosus TaxID=429701 RepID=A0A2G9HJ21_9LAMI|nr:hypothetical protein CDL12_09805 [Handroanthus impetiginosus]